ncbi:MAG: G8 domain-containing protein, partial [Bacteroidota bacterium]
MCFFKLESVNTCFWTLFCLLGMHIAQAQVNGVFVVEKDQEHMFRDSILEVDQLIIKGTFKLEDTKDVKLKFSKLLIDGGRFVAGSSENPFGHQLLLEFASELASFEVINGGN